MNVFTVYSWKMAETFDLMGHLILVFFIIVLIVMVIKILLMFPGLLDCSDDEESDENERQTV